MQLFKETMSKNFLGGVMHCIVKIENNLGQTRAGRRMPFVFGFSLNAKCGHTLVQSMLDSKVLRVRSRMTRPDRRFDPVSLDQIF